MVKGKFFAKAHFRSPKHIKSMVDLLSRNPKIEGLDITVFRKINGKKTNLSAIGKIIDQRFPFSLEYGDTDDTREVIDFLDPSKKYMVKYVKEELIPAANKMNCCGLNFHLVANAVNLPPGKLPEKMFSREKTLTDLKKLLTEFKMMANFPITVENVHCVSTRRNVDNCIKFAPVGNIVQDFFDLNWPVTLDTGHLGMSFFFYQVLQYLEKKGDLEKVKSLKDYVWCPTQRKKGESGPYLVRFGARERSMTLLLPNDLTEAILAVLKKLYQAMLLRKVHINNIVGWNNNNLFDFWDNDNLVEGVIDLPRIINFAYHDLRATLIAEVGETNVYKPKEPDFRKNLLKVVDMLKTNF